MTDMQSPAGGPSRRGVLAAVLAGLGVLGGLLLKGRPTGSATPGATVSAPALPVPDVARPALPLDPAARIRGLSTLITPNADFYRIDTADPIPMPAVDSWTLTVDGLVGKPLTLTYDELLRRDLIEVDATISCVSNWVGGSLVGNARWTGVRLDELIAEAAPTARADEVLGHSVDGFTAGFPLEVLDGRDALVAIGMNGQPLPAEHGYPARIIVPGLYGYVSAVKWLSRIELTRFDEQVGYWVPRGWAQRAPMKIASRIDSPKQSASLGAGPVYIAGVAWSSNAGISSVEVRVDNGPWTAATLGPELARSTWRQWWLRWGAPAGSHTLTVRATDGDGHPQPTTPAGAMPDGAQGLHSVLVRVE